MIFGKCWNFQPAMKIIICGLYSYRQDCIVEVSSKIDETKGNDGCAEFAVQRMLAFVSLLPTFEN